MSGLIQASQRYKFVIAVAGKGHERANPIQVAKHAGLIAAVFAGVGQAPGADCHSCGAGLHGEGDKHGWHGGAGGGLLPGSPGGIWRCLNRGVLWPGRALVFKRSQHGA